MKQTALKTPRCPAGCASTLQHRRDCPRYKPGKPLTSQTQGLQRTAMQRSTKRIKPVSDKKERELRAWRKLVVAIRAERDGCEWPQPHQCVGRIDPHHVLPRSQGGKDTKENTKLLCRLQHDFAHLHQEEARGFGMLARRDEGAA